LHNFIFIRFLRLPIILRIFLIAVAVNLLFGTIIHLVEPSTFPNIADGIWWSIVTATTIGYGDLVPKSLLGRITGVLLIVIGAGFVSAYFITLAAAVVNRQNSSIEGKVAYKGNGHIVIVGWNERSREIIYQLSNMVPLVHIVLVDETLKSNPLPMNNVHYIQGKANIDDTILQCNIHNAQKVLITADQSKDEQQADMNSILALLSIKGVCPEIPCIVEILTKEQVINAKRAGANGIIQTNNVISVFMLNSLNSEEHDLFQEVLQHLREQELKVLNVEGVLLGMNFAGASKEMLERGVLLIGIKRGDEIILHPPESLPMESTDRLIGMKTAPIHS
jgi:voltage-gated potassium channel